MVNEINGFGLFLFVIQNPEYTRDKRRLLSVFLKRKRRANYAFHIRIWNDFIIDSYHKINIERILRTKISVSVLHVHFMRFASFRCHCLHILLTEQWGKVTFSSSPEFSQKQSDPLHFETCALFTLHFMMAKVGLVGFC